MAMATKSPAKPDPKAEPDPGTDPKQENDPAGETSATLDDVKRVVSEALEPFKKLIGGGDPTPNPTESASDDKPAKRKTYRDEEDEMGTLVAAKVKELLSAEKASGENHPDPSAEKAKPEESPAKPAMSQRRVERFMGWK